MLEMERAFAFGMNELGIACRFITVDADIDYEPNTPEFYKKNGFVENLKYKQKKEVHTISMRKDIFVDEQQGMLSIFMLYVLLLEMLLDQYEPFKTDLYISC